MRGARAAIVCLLAALALPGCMRTAGPVAAVQPQNYLDAIAYGQSAYGRSYAMPLGNPLSPGDTILVGERWS
jgi:polysaccharide export outer membrane protein